jgi:hypothetical protein
VRLGDIFCWTAVVAVFLLPLGAWKAWEVLEWIYKAAVR